MHWRRYTSPIKLEYVCLAKLKTSKSSGSVTRWVSLCDHPIYYIMIDTNDLELVSGYNIVLLTVKINRIDHRQGISANRFLDQLVQRRS